MAKENTNSADALPFLGSSGQLPDCVLCCIVGDDPFLRHEVGVKLSRLFADSQGDELSPTSFDGRTVDLRDVKDALSERSLFGSQERLVFVEEADAFVKRYREQLEAFVEHPVSGALLVLEVKSWPGNTRLAKAVAERGYTIRSQVPQQGRELSTFHKQLKDWLVHQARSEYQIELKPAAVDLLLELLPTDVGMLSQEVARLSLMVDDAAPIDANLVRDHVGGWRVRKTWDMIDAAADGRAADALQQLERLLIAGEGPHALLPQLASTLRRFGSAVRQFERSQREGRSLSLRAALEQAGVPPFKLGDAEKQLRQIGRLRAKLLHRWLLAADLELKGYNSSGDRARRVLETLIVKLSRQATPATAQR